MVLFTHVCAHVKFTWTQWLSQNYVVRGIQQKFALWGPCDFAAHACLRVGLLYGFYVICVPLRRVLDNGPFSASLFLWASVSCGPSEASSQCCWCVDIVFLLDPPSQSREQFTAICWEGREDIELLAVMLTFSLILNSPGPHMVTGNGKDSGRERWAL